MITLEIEVGCVTSVVFLHEDVMFGFTDLYLDIIIEHLCLTHHDIQVKHFSCHECPEY